MDESNSGVSGSGGGWSVVVIVGGWGAGFIIDRFIVNHGIGYSYVKSDIFDSYLIAVLFIECPTMCVFDPQGVCLLSTSHAFASAADITIPRHPTLSYLYSWSVTRSAGLADS